jgi:hypothetical protein
MLQRTKPYVDAETAPPSVLDEILEQMEELVTTEGTLDSRLRRGAASSRAVHSVIEVERAAHSDPWFEYESYVTFAARPLSLLRCAGSLRLRNPRTLIRRTASAPNARTPDSAVVTGA